MTALVTTRDLGVRFLFDSQGDVVTPLRSKLALRTISSSCSSVRPPSCAAAE